jgi:hypothetical protein
MTLLLLARYLLFAGLAVVVGWYVWAVIKDQD